MRKITKKEINDYAQSGSYINPLVFTSPGGPLSYSLVSYIIPSLIEEDLPKQHYEFILNLRIEMKQELDKLVIQENEISIMEFHGKGSLILDTYFLKMKNLVGEESYNHALSINKSLQEQKKIIDNNMTMKKKLEEYQEKKCGSCGENSFKLKCSVCKQVFYCNKKCQEKDWPNHKLNCHKN